MPHRHPIWLALAVCALVAAPAAANVYIVDDTGDEPDAVPGDEICADAFGNCTLRAAFMEAEESVVGDLDEIHLPAGLYRLTRPHTPRPFPSSADGDLRTGNGPLALLGAGADGTVIEQTVEDRVINVDRGDTLIQGVTIRGGRALSAVPEDNFGGSIPRNRGGGIYVRSSLTLRSVVVTENEAATYGGGVMGASFASLVLENVEISDNTAGDTGGGLSTTNEEPRSGSGAEVDMVFGTVSGNRAPKCGGMSRGVRQGFEGSDVGAPVRIRRSRITANSSLGESGAFPDDGGGICVYSAGTSVFAFVGDFELQDSLVQGNVGGLGGGLFHLGSNPMSVLRSTLADNNAGSGAGLAILGRGLVWNSTVSGNRASWRGGGIEHRSTGTGTVIDDVFEPSPHQLSLRFSTLADNRASDGATALHNTELEDSVSALGTIFSNSGGRPECNKALDSIGSNIEDDSTPSCLGVPGPGDLVGVDPQLMSLGDNGGATPTHALRSSSPARDAYVLGAGCPGTDQRLALRPAGTACDIGAYEADAAPFELPSEPPLSPGEVGGGSVRLVFSGGVFQALSAQGIGIEPLDPADGKDATWFLPSVGGYVGQSHALLVQRGSLLFTNGKRSFEIADWVVRTNAEGGQLLSYAGQRVWEPWRMRFKNFVVAYLQDRPRGRRLLRRFRQRPLEVFKLVPTGQEPDVLVALLTKRAAHHMNRRLRTRIFKPGMAMGTLRLEPEFVDPKDPPGDPIPPHQL